MLKKSLPRAVAAIAACACIVLFCACDPRVLQSEIATAAPTASAQPAATPSPTAKSTPEAVSQTPTPQPSPSAVPVDPSLFPYEDDFFDSFGTLTEADIAAMPGFELMQDLAGTRTYAKEDDFFGKPGSLNLLFNDEYGGLFCVRHALTSQNNDEVKAVDIARQYDAARTTLFAAMGDPLYEAHRAYYTSNQNFIFYDYTYEDMLHELVELDEEPSPLLTGDYNAEFSYDVGQGGMELTCRVWTSLDGKAHLEMEYYDRKAVDEGTFASSSDLPYNDAFYELLCRKEVTEASLQNGKHGILLGQGASGSHTVYSYTGYAIQDNLFDGGAIFLDIENSTGRIITINRIYYPFEAGSFSDPDYVQYPPASPEAMFAYLSNTNASLERSLGKPDQGQIFTLNGEDYRRRDLQTVMAANGLDMDDIGALSSCDAVFSYRTPENWRIMLTCWYSDSPDGNEYFDLYMMYIPPTRESLYFYS